MRRSDISSAITEWLSLGRRRTILAVLRRFDGAPARGAVRAKRIAAPCADPLSGGRCAPGPFKLHLLQLTTGLRLLGGVCLNLRYLWWLASALSASLVAFQASGSESQFLHEFGHEITSLRPGVTGSVLVSLSDGSIELVSSGPVRKVVWSRKIGRVVALATEGHGKIAVLQEGGSVSLLSAAGELVSTLPSGIACPDAIAASDHSVVVLSNENMVFSTLSWNGSYMGKHSTPLPDISKPLSAPWGVYVNGIDELLARLSDRPRIVHSITRTMFFPPEVLGSNERVYSLWMLRPAIDIWTKDLRLEKSVDYLGEPSPISIGWNRGQRIAVLQRDTIVSINLESGKSVTIPRPSNTLDHFGEINGSLVMVSKQGDVFACGPDETAFQFVGTTEPSPVSMFEAGQDGSLIAASGSRLFIQPAETFKPRNFQK